MIWINNRDNFGTPPEDAYAGLTVCVRGTVAIYEGSAEMEVAYPDQITVVQ